MNDSVNFIKQIMAKILQEETEKAMKEAKNKTFSKAKDAFDSMFKYGAFTYEDFINACKQLNIPCPEENIHKSKITNKTSSYSDPCSHSGGMRSFC